MIPNLPERGSAEERTAFIAGLRELADFLESNPKVPVPNFGTEIVASGQFADDPRGYVDDFAALTGAKIDDTWEADGHYHASVTFGLVEYTAYAVSRSASEKYDAETSYRGCVQPDVAPVELGEVA